MVLFIVVLLAFALLRRQGAGRYQAAAIALGAGMMMSALDHVFRHDWYVSLIDPRLPNPLLLVQVSAAVRLTLGVMLLFRCTQHFALLGSLVVMLMVMPVNVQVALYGDTIEAASEMPAAWRWARLVLHGAWVGWIIGCLVMLGRLLREEAALAEDGDHVAGTQPASLPSARVLPRAASNAAPSSAQHAVSHR